MKKYFFAFICVCFAINAEAQLKPPTSNHRDTLVINSCYYNNTEVAPEDFPAYFIQQTPTSLIIAGQVYKIGKVTYSDVYSYNSSWDGHIDYYSYSNATVNGKPSKIAIVKPREDCNSNRTKIIIDDYEFYVLELKAFARTSGFDLDGIREGLLKLEKSVSQR